MIKIKNFQKIFSLVNKNVLKKFEYFNYSTTLSVNFYF